MALDIGEAAAGNRVAALAFARRRRRLPAGFLRRGLTRPGSAAPRATAPLAANTVGVATKRAELRQVEGVAGSKRRTLSRNRLSGIV